MVEIKKEILISECSRKIRVAVSCPSLPGTFPILEINSKTAFWKPFSSVQNRKVGHWR